MKPATSIGKVCRVLDAFRSRTSLGITELAQATGLLPSDVHRILRSLECFGYVEQDERTRKYRLGLELLKLGQLVHDRLELREVARPCMQRLSETAGATANLAIFDRHDLEIIFIEQTDAPGELQIRSRIGRRAPAHATAVGKVLLAYQDPRTVSETLERHGMARLTAATICNSGDFERALEFARERGYAADHSEALEGTWCIGAPVRDHRGDVVGSLAISMLQAQLGMENEPRLAQLVRNTADEVSAALGWERGGRQSRRALAIRG